MNTTFQLGAELTKAFPVRAIANSVGTRLWGLAVDLQRSGSNIVVEVELAEIFGRGRIDLELEVTFRVTVKNGTFVPFYKGSEIGFDSRPGPTMRNALQDRYFLATMVQLSFLGWVYSREQLSSLLDRCMRKRYEMGVRDASPGPGSESITATIAACSSQSSSFDWSRYIQQVEARLKTVLSDYQFSPDYLRVTPSLLLGTMDYLYLIQSLPEDRKVLISNEVGSITVIIWAHHILGLTVCLKGALENPLTFGTASPPHVTIHWSRSHRGNAVGLVWPSESEDEGPTIKLLDKDTSVVLETSPDADRRVAIQVEDRHSVRGYGLVYLQRIFNTEIFTPDDDPVYEEAVKLITALAVQASRRLDRDIGKVISEARVGSAPKQKHSSPRPQMILENWRVMASAQLIFFGHKVDPQAVNSYLEWLSLRTIDEVSFPNSFDAFLEKVPPARPGSFDRSPKARFLRQIDHLSKIVLIFAYVDDIGSCAEMPIRLTDHHTTPSLDMGRVRGNLTKRIKAHSYHMFHAVARLLTEGVWDPRDDDPSFSSRHQHFLWLVSDFGWSVFLNTFGDKDPATVRPELIRVQRGTPLNEKTGERKSRIRDYEAFTGETWRAGHKLANELEYLPRAAGTVARRTEYWNTRQQEFESAVFLAVEPGTEWCQKQDVKPFEEHMSYRRMQGGLWRTYLTPECEHHGASLSESRLKLGPDAIAILGWTDSRPACRQRIIILSTKGDPRLRWIAVQSAFENTVVASNPEQTMLRTERCCDNCALKYTATMPGRWLLIL